MFSIQKERNTIVNVPNLTYRDSLNQSHISVKGGLWGFDHAFNCQNEQIWNHIEKLILARYMERKKTQTTQETG